MPIRLSEVKPMSCGETWTHPYNAQNILENQVDFPEFAESPKEVFSVYSDRLYQGDWEKYNTLRQKHFGDRAQVWDEPDMTKTKKFLEDYFSKPITGFRVVRYTNIASGFPVWRFDMYVKSPTSPDQPLYSGQAGPLLTLTPHNL